MYVSVSDTWSAVSSCQAIQNKQFFPYFQPFIFDLISRIILISLTLLNAPKRHFLLRPFRNEFWNLNIIIIVCVIFHLAIIEENIKMGYYFKYLPFWNSSIDKSYIQSWLLYVCLMSSHIKYRYRISVCFVKAFSLNCHETKTLADFMRWYCEFKICVWNTIIF